MRWRALSITVYSDFGVYQMGEVQARSWMIGGKSAGGSAPRFTAAIVDQRGVQISNTHPEMKAIGLYSS